MSRLKKPFALAVLLALVVGLVAMPLALAAPPRGLPRAGVSPGRPALPALNGWLPPGPSGPLVSVAVSISAEAALATPASGKRLRLRYVLLNCDTAGVVTLANGTGGTVFANLYCAANTDKELTTDGALGADGILLDEDAILAADGPSSCAVRALVRATQED